LGKAVVHVSAKMLTKILKLPEGYTIDSVHASASYFPREGLSLFISSDEIPEVDEGQEYPLAMPTYAIDELNRLRIAEIKLIDMGKGDGRNEGDRADHLASPASLPNPCLR